MKTKPILPILLALCFAVSCKKEDSPIPPTEPVVKYLSKVMILGSDSSFHIWEDCIWNSQYQLKTFRTKLDFPLGTTNFHYDTLGLVSRIDYFDFNYGHGHYLLYWKDEKELDSIDCYLNDHTSSLDSASSLISKYIYHYDQSCRCVQIDQNLIGHHITSYFLGWEQNNIIELYYFYRNDENYGKSYFINNLSYDDKNSPYNAFPKIPILHFTGLLYNPSQNNPLGNELRMEYEYDEDDYPIRQYQIRDNKKELLYIFEYE